MLFTWLANRCFTFKVQHERTFAEAIRYMSIALVAALLNYLIYCVLVSIGMAPIASVATASALQSVLSFFAYQHLVFGGRSGQHAGPSA